METAKSTTITISDRTRRELLRIGAELQLKRGEKVDYEDVIQYLVSMSTRDSELLKRATAPKGVASSELQRTLRDGRLEDGRHAEELERRSS